MPLRDASEEVSIFAFMNSLKREVRVEVKLFRLITLKEAMIHAQEVK